MTTPPLDETFRAILKAAIQAGASDIHIKPGGAVVVRIEGELVQVDVPVPTESWMRMVMRAIVPPHLATRYETDHEVDFAFSTPDLGRFRANVYLQRGHPAL